MDIFDAFAHNHLQKEIDRNRRDTFRVDNAAITLEARLRALEMANGALWSLLKSKLGYTDEELVAELEAMQAQEPDTCPSCGRKLLTGNGVNCSWCGLPLERKLFG